MWGCADVEVCLNLGRLLFPTVVFPTVVDFTVHNLFLLLYLANDIAEDYHVQRLISYVSWQMTHWNDSFEMSSSDQSDDFEQYAHAFLSDKVQLWKRMDHR